VLSIDEKSQIQALNRPQKRCQCNLGGPRNARLITSGHRTTTLFTALEIATGHVTGM